MQEGNRDYTILTFRKNTGTLTAVTVRTSTGTVLTTMYTRNSDGLVSAVYKMEAGRKKEVERSWKVPHTSRKTAKAD